MLEKDWFPMTLLFATILLAIVVSFFV